MRFYNYINFSLYNQGCLARNKLFQDKLSWVNLFHYVYKINYFKIVWNGHGSWLIHIVRFILYMGCVEIRLPNTWVMLHVVWWLNLIVQWAMWFVSKVGHMGRAKNSLLLDLIKHLTTFDCNIFFPYYAILFDLI